MEGVINDENLLQRICNAWKPLNLLVDVALFSKGVSSLGPYMLK